MLPIPEGKYPTKGPLSFMWFRGITPRGKRHYHRGVDILSPLGTPVLNVEKGRVTHAIHKATRGFRGYGKVVVVRGSSGLYYLYGHLNRVDVDKGEYVQTGQQLGTVGMTAYRRGEPESLLKSKTPHLHFEASAKPYPQESEAPRVDPVEALARSPRAIEPFPGPRPGQLGVAVLALVIIAVLAFRRVD